MFLIRMAFWLSLVIVCLPSGKTEVADERASVSPMQAIFAAQAVYSDLVSMCDRSPTVCETGSAALSTFTAKAKNGARMLHDYLDGTDADIGGGGDTAGTLAPGDLEPTWAGPGEDAA